MASIASHNNGTMGTSRQIALNNCDAELFMRQNYLVIDGFLGESWASDLLKDCKEMQSGGYVTQHYFKFGDTLYEKPNIYELDLHDESKRNQSRELSFVFENAGPSFVTEARKSSPF